MKKMIKTKSQILSEGRYDSFTRFVSRVVMKSLKETEGYTENLHSYDLPYDITGEEVFEHDSGISFELELTIIRTDGEVLQARELSGQPSGPLSSNCFGQSR